MAWSRFEPSRLQASRQYWREPCDDAVRCGVGRPFQGLSEKHRLRGLREPLGSIRADDGPAWLTIVVVGHVVVPLAVYAETNFRWPIWLSTCVWPLLASGLTFLVLPCAKAIFVGAIWRNPIAGYRIAVVTRDN
jgi:uncharacterized protein (DUF983 family)